VKKINASCYVYVMERARNRTRHSYSFSKLNTITFNERII